MGFQKKTLDNPGEHVLLGGNYVAVLPGFIEEAVQEVSLG